MEVSFSVCWQGGRSPRGERGYKLHSIRRETAYHTVAPLAGSVDRNDFYHPMLANLGESLPSRGAWIEMTSTILCWQTSESRSPRGERG